MGAVINLGILIQNAMGNQQDFFASLIIEHYHFQLILCGLYAKRIGSAAADYSKTTDSENHYFYQMN